MLIDLPKAPADMCTPIAETLGVLVRSVAIDLGKRIWVFIDSGLDRYAFNLLSSLTIKHHGIFYEAVDLEVCHLTDKSDPSNRFEGKHTVLLLTFVPISK